MEVVDFFRVFIGVVQVRWETRLSDGSTVDLSSMRSAAPADFDDDIEDSVVRVSELDEYVLLLWW